jgi:1-pyrroline-5-carboxylate dehydrogenase
MAENTTYASLALTEADHQAYEEALRNFPLGEHYPIFVKGKPSLKRKEALRDIDPSDTSVVIATFPQANVRDVDCAVRTAKSTTGALKQMGWKGRFEILSRARELIRQKKYDIAAILTYEAGKNRGEAMAEVLEVIAMIDAYEKFLLESNFYSYPTNDGSEAPYEQVEISLEPLGGPVAVIVPFNFPFALCANMAMSAFLAGNPVILKPASDTPLATLQWRNIMVEAGAPEESHLFLAGPGSTVGEALLWHEDIRGIAFTGSSDVGLHINNVCAERAEKERVNIRFVAEMGGKNPVIVTRHADIRKAAMGIVRSAVGFGGQKCSAASRVYVEREVEEELWNALRDPELLRMVVGGDPKNRETFLGPLINKGAVEKYWRAVNEMMALGAPMIALMNLDQIESDGLSAFIKMGEHGYFVTPFVARIPHDHWLSREEHFVPFVTFDVVESLEEAVEKANDTVYGLCAGIFTENEEEAQYFLDNIHAGVVYVNRKGGATTGSWPTIQSFGGWGMSGLRGLSAFGPWYLTSFAREQCRTRVLR